MRHHPGPNLQSGVMHHLTSQVPGPGLKAPAVLDTVLVDLIVDPTVQGHHLVTHQLPNLRVIVTHQLPRVPVPVPPLTHQVPDPGLEAPAVLGTVLVDLIAGLIVDPTVNLDLPVDLQIKALIKYAPKREDSTSYF